MSTRMYYSKTKELPSSTRNFFSRRKNAIDAFTHLIFIEPTIHLIESSVKNKSVANSLI